MPGPRLLRSTGWPQPHGRWPERALLEDVPERSGGQGKLPVIHGLAEAANEMEAQAGQAVHRRQHHAVRLGAVQDMRRSDPDTDVADEMALPHEHRVALAGDLHAVPVRSGQAGFDHPVSTMEVTMDRLDFDVDAEALAPDLGSPMAAFPGAQDIWATHVGCRPGGGRLVKFQGVDQ